MQVGSAIAAPLVFPQARIVMGDVRPPAFAEGLSPMSVGSRIILNTIANSTRLSDVEKKSFIRLLADIDEYAGGDPRLIAKVMALVALTESIHRDGQFPRHSQASVDQLYWERRMALKGLDEQKTAADIVIPQAVQPTAVETVGEVDLVA